MRSVLNLVSLIVMGLAVGYLFGLLGEATMRLVTAMTFGAF